MLSFNQKIETKLMLLTCIFFLSSCSKAEIIEYHSISGKVTYKDKPLPYGSVIFEPDTKERNAGAQGFAEIENGLFDTSKKGRGVLGGAYNVYISGQAQKGDPAKGIIPPPLFRDFQVKINLPKEPSTQNFNIPPDATK